MNPSSEFLRKTAKKLKPLMENYDIPIKEFTESIVCYATFLSLADDLEDEFDPPPIIEEQLEHIPTGPRPPYAKQPRACLECGSALSVLRKGRYCTDSCANSAKRVRKTLKRAAVKREKTADVDNTELNSATFVDSKGVIPEGLDACMGTRFPLALSAVESESEEPKLSITKDLYFKVPERAKAPSRTTAKGVKSLVENQHGRCAYCFRFFGERVFKGRKFVVLHPIREHFVPESIGGKVLFAACHMCNFFKRDYLFQTLQECREYLSKAWERSGYKNTNGRFLANPHQFSRN